MPPTDDCVICRGRGGDDDLFRVRVWEDDLWRLTLSVMAEVPGFGYLEPKRHIPYVTDLDGEEAATFGSVLARVTRVLKEVTDSDVVYVYVFGGGVPHLHVHLAPHREGDALNDAMVRGDLVERRMPTGATMVISRDFPPLPEEELREVAERVRTALANA